MNKIAKILSVVLSVSIGVTVAMLVSAFAVTAPKFSISVAEESKDSVKLALCLESGSINRSEERRVGKECRKRSGFQRLRNCSRK